MRVGGRSIRASSAVLRAVLRAFAALAFAAIGIAAFGIAIAPTSAAADAAAALMRADSAYAHAQLEDAIVAYNAALAERPGDLRALCGLARSESELAESETGEARDRRLTSSVEHARAAVAAAPDSALGHMWLAATLGRKALHASPGDGLKMAREIKTEADRAIAIDPGSARAYHVRALWNRNIATLSFIQRAAADVALGGVPKGASLDNAVADLEKAITLQPAYVNHHYELGRTYVMMHRSDDARRELETAIALPPTSGARDPQIQAAARDLLAKLPKPAGQGHE
jgi:tetratricopeptide (TPR) repeat protein